MSYQQ